MKTRFLALLMTLTLLCSTAPTAAALEGEAVRSADTLAALNLIQGKGDDYRMDATVSRAQAAVLLVRLAGAEKAAAGVGSSPFRDVPAWAAKEIHYAASQGWVGGVTATSFQPNSVVTANGWFTMLLRMLGYSDRNGDFTVSGAAVFAQHIGLVSRSYSSTMTQGDLFESMEDALLFSYKNSETTVLEKLIQKGVCSRSAANALGLFNKSLTARQAADRHMAAVFCLDRYETEEQIEAEIPAANASGFFISSDGIAITNAHSIANGISILATLSTGEQYPVESILYYDSKEDFAIIRISRTSIEGATTSAFATLHIAEDAELRPGDVVYALSNPLGFGLSVTSGIISIPQMEDPAYALPCIINSADISQGSSGGALLNEYGHVIGITTGAYVYGNNMYLAVPTDPFFYADLSDPGAAPEDFFPIIG